MAFVSAGAPMTAISQIDRGQGNGTLPMAYGIFGPQNSWLQSSQAQSAAGRLNIAPSTLALKWAEYKGFLALVPDLQDLFASEVPVEHRSFMRLYRSAPSVEVCSSVLWGTTTGLIPEVLNTPRPRVASPKPCNSKDSNWRHSWAPPIIPMCHGGLPILPDLIKRAHQGRPGLVWQGEVASKRLQVEASPRPVGSGGAPGFGGSYASGNTVCIRDWSFTDLNGKKYTPVDGSMEVYKPHKMVWTRAGNGVLAPFYLPSKKQQVNVKVCSGGDAKAGTTPQHHLVFSYPGCLRTGSESFAAAGDVAIMFDHFIGLDAAWSELMFVLRSDDKFWVPKIVWTDAASLSHQLGSSSTASKTSSHPRGSPKPFRFSFLSAFLWLKKLHPSPWWKERPPAMEPQRGPARFLAVNAEFKGSMLDTTSVISGILASPEATMCENDGRTTACEAFSGGYSGWTQAMRCLSKNGFPFCHKIAIDCDQHAMEAFMKSHGFTCSVGPERFDWGRSAIPDHLFIHADIMLHGWYHLFSNTAFDVMMLSPPCPPWSYASLQQGLLKEEGRLTLHGWGLVGMLKPKVVLMEMVGGMKDHCHWKLIRELILWFGYSLRFARNCNLSEIAPQHRDRLIVIATLDEAQLFPHLPAAWPVTQRQTLESYLSILDLSEPWLSQCTLSSELMAIYLDPLLLPKALDQRGKSIKRSKRDVEQYRIKHPHGTFGCVMSNYSYGHLLPEVSLRHAGLFGTLIALPTGLRFISVPEILILQTTLESCWLPECHRVSIKLLGNSISVPHALLGLVNALAFLYEEVACEDIREIMIRMMSKRMTSRNIHWERKLGGFAFTISDDACAPTMVMHSERVIALKSPLDVVAFRAEVGVNVCAALTALLGESLPNELSLLPAGDLDARVSLQRQMTVGEHDIQLFSSVPCALQISTNAFSVTHNQDEMIVVLTREGTFVIRRDHGMTVEDVITIVDHSFGIRCTHLVGILGERHPKLMIAPNAVIALDVEGASDEMDIIDFLRTKVDDFGISFLGTFGVLRDFWEVLYRTALTEIIASMGWMLVTSFHDVIDSDINALQLVRKPGALAVTQGDLLYCIAIHLFLTKIRSWLVLGERPAVRCKLRLWHVWIWDSLIDPSKSLQDFEEAWQKISDFLHISKPWRFVCQGRCMNPEWPLSSFVETSEHGTPELTIYMRLGLHGGGPGSVKLRTQAEATYCDNFQDFAHMESENFESALAVALRMMVKADQPIPRYDITRFLQIEANVTEGFYKMCGDFEVLRELFNLLSDIGIDKILMKCGWLPMCAIKSFPDPLEVEMVFVQVPSKPAVTIHFLKSFLRSVLVTLGMPNQTDNDDDVILKMKLWEVVIFNAKLPRMFPMQELMDVWDQACTIVGAHWEVRLVSHTGVVNPDFALKHYSRCGANDVSTAVMTFVGALRGGADLKESMNFIDSILKGAGGGAVSSIMGQKRIGKKWEGLTQLAMALNIPIPQIAQKLQNAKQKAQKKFQTQNRTLPANIPVESLCLKAGFLKNQDDTNCHQLTKMVPNVSGVVLMKFSEAREWIEKDVVLSQDELAVIVIGKCMHEATDKCCKIQLPVCLKDEPLILQACLHQLGAKHVKVENHDDTEIPTNETQVMCVTAVRQEIPQDAWEALLQAPVKSMINLLGSDVADIVFVSPPWGRSFQANSKKVSPEQAMTVQFHCRIHRSDSRSFLRASGNGGIYTCPKTEAKQISQDYMVVWMKVNHVDLAVCLSQCENHMGLVKSLKGDSMAKGIRFLKQDFPAAFSKLRPGEELPSQISANHFFRVEPTPVGTTAEQMQAWISANGWKAKPVRSLNATAWLCAAEVQFEEVFQQWNNMPVLIKWIQQKKDFQPIVLAGNVQKVMQVSIDDVPQAQASEPGHLHPDPWATWMKNHGSTGIAISNQSLKMSTSGNVMTQPPRKLESPIEDKFQRQDEQLQSIRDDAEREIKCLKENMSRLEKVVDGQRIQMERNVETTASEFRSLRADTASQFQQMAEMFKDSLTNAIQAQNGSMNAQFSELKAMIASAPAKASPPQKKHKPTAENDPYMTS
eukprot:s2876_g1.t1